MFARMLQHPAARVIRVAAMAATTITFAACSSSTSPGSEARSISLISGEEQTAAVGSTLPTPIVLLVTDQHGKAMPGQAVNLYVSFNDGAISVPTVDTTDASGQLTFNWTLSSVAKPDTIIATVATPDTYSDFSAVVIEGIATASSSAQVVARDAVLDERRRSRQ